LATGFIFGDLFTFAVLFNLTKNMNPVYGFAIASFSVILIAISLLFIVKEPNMEKLHESRRKDENW
jgi:competence protein ComGC